jgi:hypothetical protein
LDRKRRRTGADTNAHSNSQSEFHSYADREPDSKSDSSRTAASDTRTSPDTLSSVAASPTVILAREGNSATGAVLNHVHTVLLNRLASGPHLGSDRSVTFYCSG